jgi:hypothetical protein
VGIKENLNQMSPTIFGTITKNNNLAVALVVGSIIITLSLMTHDGVELLIESLIPYPDQYPK